MCVENSSINFNSAKLHPVDFAYKKVLQKNLQDSYGIKCKVEDLRSIAGPIEMRDIIKKLNPFQYIVGENFRANFHIHSNASDGRMSAIEYLELCKDWADKIFKDKNPQDNLPPFSASLTDHNKIDNVKDVIALISQNPEKYENFKFITGCEFLLHGYKAPYTAFEAVGLGFNPFDKDLEPMTHGFKSHNEIETIKTIKKDGALLSWAHPIITPDKINPEFFQFLKSNGIEAVEGNYQYSKWDQEYVASIKPDLDKLIKEFDMVSTGGTDSHIKSIF